MRIRALALLTLATAIATAGCSTKHASGGPDFVRFKIPVQEGAALVYVFRYRAEPPDALTTLQVNGVDIVDLKRYEYTWFYAPPGRLALAARWPQVTLQHNPSLNLDVYAGSTYYVELTGVDRVTGLGTSITSTLEPLALDRAEEKLDRCKYRKPRTAKPGS